MAVGQKYRVDRCDLVMEALKPKLGARINLDGMTLDDYMDARPRPPITRIGKVQARIGVGNKGYPLGRPTAEYGDFHTPKGACPFAAGKHRRLRPSQETKNY
jgi:hypothetical protein